MHRIDNFHGDRTLSTILAKLAILWGLYKGDYHPSTILAQSCLTPEFLWNMKCWYNRTHEACLVLLVHKLTSTFLLSSKLGTDYVFTRNAYAEFGAKSSIPPKSHTLSHLTPKLIRNSRIRYSHNTLPKITIMGGWWDPKSPLLKRGSILGSCCFPPTTITHQFSNYIPSKGLRLPCVKISNTKIALIGSKEQTTFHITKRYSNASINPPYKRTLCNFTNFFWIHKSARQGRTYKPKG